MGGGGIFGVAHKTIAVVLLFFSVVQDAVSTESRLFIFDQKKAGLILQQERMNKLTQYFFPKKNSGGTDITACIVRNM